MVLLLVIWLASACSGTTDDIYLEPTIDDRVAHDESSATVPTSNPTFNTEVESGNMVSSLKILKEPNKLETIRTNVLEGKASSKLDPGQQIELKLPFKTNFEPEGIMPMGETINHSPPRGHPGIDFQWSDKHAEIIVALDGVVGDIVTEISPYDGDTVYVVKIITGEFGVLYEVVDLNKFIPDLQVGDKLSYGTILGYPQIVESGAGRMTHWGFGKAYASGGRANPEGVIENYFFEWLCPVEYFTKTESLRLQRIWETAHYIHKDEFPNICNEFFGLSKDK